MKTCWIAASLCKGRIFHQWLLFPMSALPLCDTHSRKQTITELLPPKAKKGFVMTWWCIMWLDSVSSTKQESQNIGITFSIKQGEKKKKNSVTSCHHLLWWETSATLATLQWPVPRFDGHFLGGRLSSRYMQHGDGEVRDPETSLHWPPREAGARQNNYALLLKSSSGIVFQGRN